MTSPLPVSVGSVAGVVTDSGGPVGSVTELVAAVVTVSPPSLSGAVIGSMTILS